MLRADSAKSDAWAPLAGSRAGGWTTSTCSGSWGQARRSRRVVDAFGRGGSPALWGRRRVGAGLPLSFRQSHSKTRWVGAAEDIFTAHGLSGYQSTWLPKDSFLAAAEMKKRPDGATIEPLLFRHQEQPLGREGAQPKTVLAMP